MQLWDTYNSNLNKGLHTYSKSIRLTEIEQPMIKQRKGDTPLKFAFKNSEDTDKPDAKSHIRLNKEIEDEECEIKVHNINNQI